MHIVVLVLGAIAALAGLTAVVLGFAIKEFALGGTMLIIGTTTLVGGLVMIAVAGAIRELSRIAKALSRPLPAPRIPRPGEPFDAYAPGGFRPGITAPRPPSAPVPPPMPARSSQPPARDADERKRAPDPLPELHEPAAPALQPEEQVAAEVSAELEESDRVSLSPNGPLPADEASPASAFPPAEAPEAEQSSAEAPQQDADDEPAGDVDTEHAKPREEPLTSVLGRPLPFDAIWPPRESPGRRFAETESGEAEPRRASAVSVWTEDASAAAESDAEPDASWQPASQTPDSEADDTQAEAPYAVSILKSGVVDGMAYTLYSDGSIEAELPSGTIRFASINELRMHLEKAG